MATTSLKAPKISVLMPAYNVEKYVGEAIESILSQTFSDFEFIIINDGSTDKTAEVINQYVAQDKRIKFIDNKFNSGLISILNQGMDMATGEYIARMDSDDISMPERFAKQVQFMDKNPDVGMSGTQFIKFGECEEKLCVEEKNIGELNVLQTINSCIIGHPTVFMRRSVFDKHGLRYNPEFVYCEDYELWTQVIRHTKIVNMPDLLYRYRWHLTNVSVKYRDTQLKNASKVRTNALEWFAGNGTARRAFSFFMGKENVVATVKLFGLPILTVRSVRSSKKAYLFGFIHIIKIRRGIIYLFHFIPVGKIKF